MKKRCPEMPGLFQVIFLSLGMLVQGCSVDYPMGDFLWSDSVEQPDTFIPETCNNGTLDDGEFCDPTAVQSADCRDISSWFVSGVASCTADCRWDLGDCVRHSKECGNGILEPGEACEPSLNPSASCASLSARYVSGVAECDNWCSFDVTSCVVGESNCGDGILEGEEECDNGLENGASRCSLDCRVLSNGEKEEIFDLFPGISGQLETEHLVYPFALLIALNLKLFFHTASPGPPPFPLPPLILHATLAHSLREEIC